MTTRRDYALRVAADALEADPRRLRDLLADYNDPASPMTVVEVVWILRKEADR